MSYIDPSMYVHVLSRDGKEVFRGTEWDCLEYIHKTHSYSMYHALRYEGYTLEVVAL